MGTTPSTGRRQTMTEEEIKTVFSFPEGLEMDRFRTFSCGCLSKYSIFKKNDPHKEIVQKKLMSDGFDKKTDRAIGALLGLAIGDALGAPLEFAPVRYGSKELKGLDQLAVWVRAGYNKFGLKQGQWTDDTSMALCLADSLIVSKGFNPIDLRMRFLNWWTFGYCNAFGYDSTSDGCSVGLGGNISQSFSEFLKKRTEYTTAGDLSTSGNGSIMRLAAVPIYYHGDIKTAEDVAYKQSKTTHQGEEAAECCRLLAHCVVKGIHSDGSKDFLDKLPETFKSPLYSVTCLTAGVPEEEHEENKKLKLEDRRWDWKDENFKYAESRARSQPGYVGSYSMDAMAMALHCVYSTSSLSDAMLKCANLRGDSDSVCAVAGQVAGSIYGASAIPKEWIKYLQSWDDHGDISLRAYKLYNHLEL